MTGGAKPATRLHVDEALSPGRTLGLDHARAHFLRSVLRLAPGAQIAVFNGADGEWLAEIEGLGKGWCSLLLLERRRAAAPEPDLWLVFAPIKRARLDFMAEKATELGCSVLQPVMTRFTAVSRVNEERLAANAREAAEQCERLTLPEVRETVSFDRLLDTWPAQRRLLVCAEWGAAQPVAVALQAMRVEPPGEVGPWAVMTGPKGVKFALGKAALRSGHNGIGTPLARQFARHLGDGPPGPGFIADQQQAIARPVAQEILKLRWLGNLWHCQAFRLFGGFNRIGMQSPDIDPVGVGVRCDDRQQSRHPNLGGLGCQETHRRALDRGENQPQIGFLGLIAQQLDRFQQHRATFRSHDGGPVFAVPPIEHGDPITLALSHHILQIMALIPVQ